MKHPFRLDGLSILIVIILVACLITVLVLLYFLPTPVTHLQQSGSGIVKTPVNVISVAAALSLLFWVISFLFDRADKRRTSERDRTPRGRRQ
ncbi:MAG TPA: hypothetical protein VFB28_11710 [Terriglobales bacterium]|nr:hypothetical protein [Terriglobales bacterium]